MIRRRRSRIHGQGFVVSDWVLIAVGLATFTAALPMLRRSLILAWALFL